MIAICQRKSINIKIRFCTWVWAEGCGLQNLVAKATIYRIVFSTVCVYFSTRDLGFRKHPGEYNIV